MAIEFNNVSYLDKLKNFSYTFSDNKITFLTGVSGSGKTLISYLIMGLLVPDSGDISVCGNIIDKNSKNFKSIRRNIGYVFEDASVEFFCDTVKEEIEFGLKRYNYDINRIDKRVIDSLKMVGLNENYLDKNPFNLSSGEKEKLAIAISLSLNPNILILDEPTTYLDDKSKKELINLLLIMKNKYNKTIIIISNDINFITSLGDKVVALKKGKLSLDIDRASFLDNVDKLKKNGIEIPKIIEFINMAEKYKNKKLSYTLDIDSLVSEIKNV